VKRNASGNDVSQHRRSIRDFVLTLVLTILVASGAIAPGAGADGAKSHQDFVAPRFSAGIVRCTFVDHSREVLNYQRTPYRIAAKSRTLVTEIRYPTALVSGANNAIPRATPVTQVGGYPTIVFAHGYDVTPDTYAPLLNAWAEAGFVVVAPFFPDEDASAVLAQHGANTEDDVINEPGDLAFVTKEVIEDSAAASPLCPILAGLIAPQEIALAGHSDGAEAVGMLAYDHGLDPQGVNYASLRSGIDYRAVIILSGAEDTYQSNADEASRPDLLMIHSLADQCNPFRNGVQLYDAIHQANKWFLELRTAHHLPPFDGVDRSAFALVVATTISFLSMSLEDATTTATLTSIGDEEPSVATMLSGPEGPSLTNVPHVEESCGPN
jgi:hypothetical protein